MKTVFARRLFITFLPAVFVLTAIAAVSVTYQVQIPLMTRDVTAIADIHPLSGILSNLGILLWCAATSICLFSALTLWRVKSKRIFWFLLSSALLSMYLLFDDFFLFHEVLIARYLGLSEKIVYGVLGIAISSYLIVFRRVILRTDYVYLLLALGLLTSSVFIDAALERWIWQLDQWMFLLEDGIKWLGIASWCSYYVQTSFQLFGSSLVLSTVVVQPDVSASRR
ncbi:MAG: hypothetical protein HY785_03375 [Oscillatoriophycideae cyanobacterium NC_groundwater_1537_Pr4_S-0.65um_50_18]|nr:hypothetical protein [Oscillatoriophycideae cyanobacterium NC_groundwater_1537_Pr4_S-0.65um_50_18]